MIIFLYGEDTFRSRQKLKELKERFLREIDPNGSSLTVLDGKNLTIEKINQTVSPGSLLAKKRLVIIEELFTNKAPNIFEQVYQYLKNKKFVKNDNITIFWESQIKTKKIKNKEIIVSLDNIGRERVLTKQQQQLFNFLHTQKYSQQFNLLNNTEVAAWTKKEVIKRGGKISNQAVQILTSLVGSDLWHISNEIDKLLSYKSAVRPKLTGVGAITIEVDDVENLVRGNMDENIFALTDAISHKNKALASRLLEEQLAAGLTDNYLLAMFIRQFKILLQIKQAQDVGFNSRKIVSSLKLHPFVVQKGLNQVRNFSLATLKNIINQLVRIDYLMKTGKADIHLMLNLLIAKI